MLKSKLDPGRKALAVQDLCHLSQGKNEVHGWRFHSPARTNFS